MCIYQRLNESCKWRRALRIISYHPSWVEKSDSSLLSWSHSIQSHSDACLSSSSVSGMLWNITQEFASPAVSHEWSWNWENIFVIKKCGDISPFQGWFPTPVTWLHWNTWFWWFTLGFSSHGASSFPPATVIPVGRGWLHHGLNRSWNLERTFPSRARTVLLILMSLGRIETFLADILIR